MQKNYLKPVGGGGGCISAPFPGFATVMIQPVYFILTAARKRHGLSVAELAAMLSQLKSRGAATDDGVKLQSLRFGGYE